MGVFYAYSNNRPETKMTYEKVCKKFPKDEIIDVSYNDSINSHLLLNKIKNHVKSSFIFVCDLTPDYIINEKESESIQIVLPNPNAMLELGFALNYFENNNIILLMNEKISKKIPSMLNGFDIIYYNSNERNYISVIVKKIESNIDNILTNYAYILENKEWKTFDYTLSNKFITSLEGIVDIKLTKNIIRINKEINQAVILLYGITR